MSQKPIVRIACKTIIKALYSMLYSFERLPYILLVAFTHEWRLGTMPNE